MSVRFPTVPKMSCAGSPFGSGLCSSAPSDQKFRNAKFVVQVQRYFLLMVSA
jgi:hypothetical protein